MRVVDLKNERAAEIARREAQRIKDARRRNVDRRQAEADELLAEGFAYLERRKKAS